MTDFEKLQYEARVQEVARRTNWMLALFCLVGVMIGDKLGRVGAEPLAIAALLFIVLCWKQAARWVSGAMEAEVYMDPRQVRMTPEQYIELMLKGHHKLCAIRGPSNASCNCKELEANSTDKKDAKAKTKHLLKGKPPGVLNYLLSEDSPKPRRRGEIG